MNLEQYTALTGDTKLAAATAIACGWQHIKAFGKYEIRVAYDEDFVHQGVHFISWYRFDPFADDSIPYRLIGQGVDSVIGHVGGGFSAISLPYVYTSDSKTHAIVQAYISADQMGHLAKFLKGE